MPWINIENLSITPIKHPYFTSFKIRMNVSGKERIILFGGRTQDKLALEDCYSFDTQTNVWTKVTLDLFF